MGGKNESNLSRIPPKPDQRDLVSYFRRYRDIFFGPEPGELHKFKPLTSVDSTRNAAFRKLLFL